MTICIHPDRSREFGWLLGKTNDWKADFPQLASRAGATQGSADIVPDQAARPGGIALAPAVLAGAEWVARHRRPSPDARWSWRRPTTIQEYVRCWPELVAVL